MFSSLSLSAFLSLCGKMLRDDPKKTVISFFLPMLPAQIHELFVFYRIPLAQKVNELLQMISLLPLESVRPWSEKKKLMKFFVKTTGPLRKQMGNLVI